MHTYGHLLLLSSLTVVKKFLRLSECQEQSEINAFPNTGIPTPLRTSVHTFPTTKIAIRMETPQIYKTFFNPPTNPHHKSKFVKICANLWVIYWKHELHESYEFDFCGFLFA